MMKNKIKSELHHIKAKLTATAILLLRNGISFDENLKIDGLITVTVDGNELFFIKIEEELVAESASSVASDAEPSGNEPSAKEPLSRSQSTSQVSSSKLSDTQLKSRDSLAKESSATDASTTGLSATEPSAGELQMQESRESFPEVEGVRVKVKDCTSITKNTTDVDDQNYVAVIPVPCETIGINMAASLTERIQSDILSDAANNQLDNCDDLMDLSPHEHPPTSVYPSTHTASLFKTSRSPSLHCDDSEMPLALLSRPKSLPSGESKASHKGLPSFVGHDLEINEPLPLVAHLLHRSHNISPFQLDSSIKSRISAISPHVPSKPDANYYSKGQFVESEYMFNNEGPLALVSEAPGKRKHLPENATTNSTSIKRICNDFESHLPTYSASQQPAGIRKSELGSLQRRSTSDDDRFSGASSSSGSVMRDDDDCVINGSFDNVFNTHSFMDNSFRQQQLLRDFVGSGVAMKSCVTQEQCLDFTDYKGLALCKQQDKTLNNQNIDGDSKLPCLMPNCNESNTLSLASQLIQNSFLNNVSSNFGSLMDYSKSANKNTTDLYESIAEPSSQLALLEGISRSIQELNRGISASVPNPFSNPEAESDNPKTPLNIGIDSSVLNSFSSPAMESETSKMAATLPKPYAETSPDRPEVSDDPEDDDEDDNDDDDDAAGGMESINNVVLRTLASHYADNVTSQGGMGAEEQAKLLSSLCSTLWGHTSTTESSELSPSAASQYAASLISQYSSLDPDYLSAGGLTARPIRSRMPRRPRESLEKTHVCVLCNLSYYHKKHLKHHLKQKHWKMRPLYR